MSAISAMGNSHKNDQSTTRSAVSENIKIEVKTPENSDILHLSRDTKNANQKVQQFDVAEYRERTEMAQVIAEISQNTVSIWLKPRLDEAEKQKAEAESIIKNANASQAQKEQATAQLRQANEVITNYGTGSNLQLAIRAVTGALQGIATGNAGAAVAGGLSPFANKAIKDLTQGNDTANLMAHAVLGAIEAQASGNNAIAGAAGAATGEATAQFITQYLYKKPANQLTESEKQTVSALSQFASGLAGATVGNSTQSAVAAMETGKRAVENNNLATVSIKKGYPVIRNILCTQKCLSAIAGMGIGASIVLSGSEIEDAINASISADPQKIGALSDLQRQYLNEQVLKDPNSLFLGGQVWIPNADGGFSPIDPALMPKNPEGKPILDPRIFVNHTGDIQYPADYEIPHNTGGNQILEQDKNSNILVGGETNVGDWRDNTIFAKSDSQKAQDERARRLGYDQKIPPQKAPFNSHGQPVYWNGKNYITPDRDGHNVTDGWKLFDRRGIRKGTYDKYLENKIKG